METKKGTVTLHIEDIQKVHQFGALPVIRESANITLSVLKHATMYTRQRKKCTGPQRNIIKNGQRHIQTVLVLVCTYIPEKDRLHYKNLSNNLMQEIHDSVQEILGNVLSHRTTKDDAAMITTLCKTIHNVVLTIENI